MGTLRPLDIATRHTVDFIAGNLRPQARLVEVGCGNGELARELLVRGFAVTGVDANPDCIAHARTLGVDALHCEWPECAVPGSALDALAFTRSLHHVARLDASIAHAQQALRVGGLLLVEDFAHDTIDVAALEWFAGVVRAHVAALPSGAHGLVAELTAHADPREWPGVWRRYHAHDHALHPLGAMREAIRARFAIRGESRVPYLYRYLIPLLPQEPKAAALIEAVLADELRGAAEGRFVPVGWRLVAVR